ncbi:hypothetical protein BASA83_004259 [Batrachochytrium salamandrivorans]|nr:hypothetical protein BASA83_004259 [Batrachochytrium salamandrivorans]
MQPQKQPRERQTRSQWRFTHRIREDGEVFSTIVRFVRQPKKARDASPPPQGRYVGVVKNPSQQFAASTDRAGYSE